MLLQGVESLFHSFLAAGLLQVLRIGFLLGYRIYEGVLSFGSLIRESLLLL